MKVSRTVDRKWVIEAETSDEQKQLEWLIESLRSHPDQRVVACGSTGDQYAHLPPNGILKYNNETAK